MTDRPDRRSRLIGAGPPGRAVELPVLSPARPRLRRTQAKDGDLPDLDPIAAGQTGKPGSLLPVAVGISVEPGS
ncbi:unnamed protein product [Calypogeia fissa]